MINTLPIGTYRIKRKYRRKHAKNRTYNRKLTTHREAENRKEMLVIVTVMLITLSANVIWTNLNSLANRSFSIINDQVVPTQVEAAKSVESIRTVVVAESTATSPVETPEQEIRRIASEMNFKWPDYLVRLAKCESSLNPQAININRNGTADKGIFQINDVHGLSDEFRYDIRKSTEWTINKINQGEQHIWVCDRILKNNINK